MKKSSIELAGNESSKLSEKVLGFLESACVQVSELQYIYVVVWPGSFTGIRSITLFVNTLAYAYDHIKLIPLSFFDLYSSYPIIKQSSRRDVFVKKDSLSIIKILSREELQEYLSDIPHCFWSFDWELFSIQSEIHNSYDIEEILQHIQTKAVKCVSALYIKKPNIS